VLNCLADFLNRAHAGNFSRNFSNEKQEERMKERLTSSPRHAERLLEQGGASRRRAREFNKFRKRDACATSLRLRLAADD
jgi:hypothetical protein